MKHAFKLVIILLASSVQMGCNKLVSVPEPTNTTTTTETFSTSGTANAALVGIYENMMNSGGFAGGASTFDGGMSADELNYFGNPNLFQANALTSTGGQSDFFWTGPYFNIYQANAAIEGLQASANLSAGTKSVLTGEAKFLRAFCYFYLVNCFGSVPLVLTTSYANNSLMSNTPTTDIYAQIVGDLKAAQAALPTDYSLSNGERTRANYWAATALLARVYLYEQQWDSAEVQSTTVLNNNTGTYYLYANPDSTFLANSSEAILQFEQDYIGATNTYATTEGHDFIPYDTTSSPEYTLTNELLNAFESGDLRKADWVDSTDYNGTYYYYPYKYKLRITTQDNIAEYPMVLRLAEQYLIRAEARAKQGNLSRAIADLNTIRTRAMLDSLSPALTQAEVLAAVVQERRVELFAEFGHRWFDLKRTDSAAATLTANKGFAVPGYQLLYPIPYSECQTDPNLTQNPGYAQ